MRAVVGSLVLCAALAPHASAQQAEGASRVERVEVQTLRDFWGKVKSSVERGEIDLNGTFALMLEAERDEDGSLHNVIITRTEASDKHWRELAPAFAFSLSTSTDALQRFDRIVHPTTSRRVNISLKLDDQNLVGKMVYTIERDDYVPRSNPDLNQVWIQSSGRRDKDQDIVFRHMSFSCGRKQLRMHLEMTREQAGNLLRKHLSLP
ncbi:MAG: hypothetical protein LC803_14030 [Acidobacteria bacterium]|nr:hypothetical protein [Acidobacteriota bacterium]